MTPTDRLVGAVVQVLTAGLRSARFREEPRFVWRRDAQAGRLNGKWEQRRTLERMDWGEQGAELDGLLDAIHPSLPGLVGTATAGQFRLDGDRLLASLAYQIAGSDGEGDLEPFVQTAVEQLRRILSGEELVSLKFIGPTSNAQGEPGVQATFADGTVFRQLTPDELDDVFSSIGVMPNFAEQVAEWGLIGEVALPVVVGNEAPFPTFEQQSDIQRRLGLACLAIRLARAAPANYHKIVLTQKAGILSSGVSTLYGRASRERRVGSVSATDAREAERLSVGLGTPRHPALDVALERFGTGVSRWEPRDRIIDVVIGMEAILLAATEKPEYRGELGYRFAVNAGFLETTPQTRRAAYRKARHAYGLRSTLAHGGVPTEPVKLGDASLTLREAADELGRLLRDLIVRFLPEAGSPSFAKPDFWIDQYFAK